MTTVITPLMRERFAAYLADRMAHPIVDGGYVSVVELTVMQDLADIEGGRWPTLEQILADDQAWWPSGVRRTLPLDHPDAGQIAEMRDRFRVASTRFKAAAERIVGLYDGPDPLRSDPWGGTERTRIVAPLPALERPAKPSTRWFDEAVLLGAITDLADDPSELNRVAQPYVPPPVPPRPVWTDAFRTATEHQIRRDNMIRNRYPRIAALAWEEPRRPGLRVVLGVDTPVDVLRYLDRHGIPALTSNSVKWGELFILSTDPARVERLETIPNLREMLNRPAIKFDTGAALSFRDAMRAFGVAAQSAAAQIHVNRAASIQSKPRRTWWQRLTRKGK